MISDPTSPEPNALHRYVAEKSSASFQALVEQYADFVYAAALRRLNGNTHHAEEVTQLVFTDLARKAPALLHHTSLLGWLHTSARYASLRLIRNETRRRTHEAAAAMENNLLPPEASPEWEKIRPLIDEALDRLSDTDREALLLRYFHHRSHAEIAATLGLSEEAARKRIDRALGKLAPHLQRRGITSTAAALGLALASAPAIAAPAHLTATLGTTALAAAATTGALATAQQAIAAYFAKLGTALSIVVASATTLAAVYAIQQNHALKRELNDVAAATAQAREIQARRLALENDIAQTRSLLVAPAPKTRPDDSSISPALWEAGMAIQRAEQEMERFVINRRYQPIFEALDLPPEKLAALKTLLGTLGDQAAKLKSTRQPGSIFANPSFIAYKEKEAAALRRLLGEEKFSIYRSKQIEHDYVRPAADIAATELADLGHPLTAAQRQVLDQAYRQHIQSYYETLPYPEAQKTSELRVARAAAIEATLPGLAPEQQKLLRTYLADVEAYEQLNARLAPDLAPLN